MKGIFQLMAVIAAVLVTTALAFPADASAALALSADKFTLGDGTVSFGIAGLIINQANLAALFKGFKASFNTGFRDVTPMWNQIATLVPSATSEEIYAWLGQFPRLREWIGDRQVKGLAAHDYTIKNKKFESTVGVPRDNIDDDTYGIFAPMFQEMGYAAATHPDELVFAQLFLGLTELCYDGQYFFDTDHPVNGASVANKDAGGSGSWWYLLDTSRPLKPLIFQKRRDYDFKQMTARDDEAVFMREEYRYGVDARVNTGFGFWQLAYASNQALDATHFDASFKAMEEFKSDEGRPLGVKPNLLVCSPGNRSAARTLLELPTLSGGGANPNYQQAKVVVSSWLAD